MNEVPADKKVKSSHAEREEKVLTFWQKNDIFNKSLAKKSPKGEFIFYEGPPTANGRPGIHHLEARAFKDAIPRYKTMQGFHVRRKGGWDTHGLPVELQVEKELGLKSKKEIESYGIGAFNQKCKESVWTYVNEWEEFTNRMGYWVDLKNPYVTYKTQYIESVWNIMQIVDKKGLLYKDYRVVPWCARCGTALSSHELAQGYEDVKDLSVYVKFKVRDQANTYLLAWTTTPWTLPGNVGLAVGANIEYVKARIITKAIIQKIGTGTYESTNPEFIYIAKEIINKFPESPKGTFQKGDQNLIIEKDGIMGSDLAGLSYEPVYPFLHEIVKGKKSLTTSMDNAYKVWSADFVTTSDGTGIVHIAPMYGQDDFELGTKNGLPKVHLVDEAGNFIQGTGFLAGKFVKSEGLDVEIIRDLAGRGLLFDKEKYQHTYPFCWRCKTPLIYYARDSWYIRMSSLRDKLVKENADINWEPSYIKNGRFGEWLSEVKDWAISRERYWGTPLPVWNCGTCQRRKVVGSIEELKQRPKNTYFVIRHGQSENNVTKTMSSVVTNKHHLTDLGKEQVRKSAETLKHKKIDLIITSPFLRTKETAEIVREVLGLGRDQVIEDTKIVEWKLGILEGVKVSEFEKALPHDISRFEKHVDGAENYADIKKRMGDFLYGLESKYEGKNILVVTHGGPAGLLISASEGLDREQTIAKFGSGDLVHNAEIFKLNFSLLPHNEEYETDLHRPYIDEVKLECSCGGKMSRIKEVMDVWFDSGAMPFAQDHYPFEKDSAFKPDSGLFKKSQGYPADFISEAIDQTRGWFYTLHAIGALLGKGKAYKNVICLGHILDKDGKKMSKSVGNVVNPWEMMDKYGADALRFWMYSVNQPGESKNFDERTVDEVVKKVFNLAGNVLAFYQLYATEKSETDKNDRSVRPDSTNVLDQWILNGLDQMINEVTINLDRYKFFESSRSIREFIAELSQWYLRRSRDRFKEDGADKQAVIATLRFVIIHLAKVMAPLTPFFAEYLYEGAGGSLESVHLESWPVAGKVDRDLIQAMDKVRAVSSKGLEARTNAKINVRQPLSELKIKDGEGLSVGLLELIKDEVNVKDVVVDAGLANEVELNINLTPELKEEGSLRELVRKIQEMRKEKGLKVGDVARLTLTEDLRMIVAKYEGEIKKATGVSKIDFGPALNLKV